MCFTLSNVKAIGKWNWEGDEIIHSPIIRACRSVPGYETRYDIDIREFLSIRDNAVVRRALREIADGMPVGRRTFFRSRQQGSFDFRVEKILGFVSEKIRYGVRGKMRIEKRRFDAWLFPDEVLEVREGDCEDRAFLLAALLLASGVSGYVLRVALGRLYNVDTKEQKDHVWVMYKNEEGIWICLEPMLASRAAERSARSYTLLAGGERPHRYEYIPYYLFNNDHLWRIRDNVSAEGFPDYLAHREFFAHFDPEFATRVHNQLIDEALPDLNWIRRIYVKAVSLSMDSVQSYDPLAHFDNGYVAEAWDELARRLDLRDSGLNNLAYLVHAAADLYAHTSWAHFAATPGARSVPLFDPELVRNLQVDYRAGEFDLRDTKRFSVNASLYNAPDRQEAVDYCTGKKIISGRFAQPHDQAQGTLERYLVQIPFDMRHAEGFGKRGALPHHNEIAVDSRADGTAPPAGHTLYGTREAYNAQFDLRFDAAKRHIAAVYARWKS